MALKTEYLDVLLLHRPDTLVEPEEVAAAFDALEAKGKVRHFGVSNQSPGQIELLKTAVKQPLLFNQVQLSITHANLIARGVANNMAGLGQSVDRDNGLLDYSRLKGMMLQAWSPFQKGFFDGVFIGDRDNYAELNQALDEVAKSPWRDADRHRGCMDRAASGQHSSGSGHHQPRSCRRIRSRLGRVAQPRGVVPPIPFSGAHSSLTVVSLGTRPSCRGRAE